jgi:hypothetical protein
VRTRASVYMLMPSGPWLGFAPRHFQLSCGPAGGFSAVGPSGGFTVPGEGVKRRRIAAQANIRPQPRTAGTGLCSVAQETSRTMIATMTMVYDAASALDTVAREMRPR